MIGVLLLWLMCLLNIAHVCLGRVKCRLFGFNCSVYHFNGRSTTNTSTAAAVTSAIIAARHGTLMIFDWL